MPEKGYKDIKEEVITKRTGKDFRYWRQVLDKFGVEKHGRKASAEHLKNIHKINPWWAQVLVIRYEFEKKLKN